VGLGLKRIYQKGTAGGIGWGYGDIGRGVGRGKKEVGEARESGGAKKKR